MSSIFFVASMVITSKRGETERERERAREGVSERYGETERQRGRERERARERERDRESLPFLEVSLAKRGLDLSSRSIKLLIHTRLLNACGMQPIDPSGG